MISRLLEERRSQIDRFTTAWRKLLDVKGQPPGPHASVEIESDRPEWSFLKGEYRFSALLTVSPAATGWVLAVRNPPGSGIIAVITRASIQTPVALVGTGGARYTWGIWENDPGSIIGPCLPMDTRWFRTTILPDGQSGGLLLRSNITGVATNRYITEAIPDLAAGAKSLAEHLPVILGEGMNYGVNTTVVTTAATGIIVNISGYLRARNAGELTPGG